MPDYIQLYSDMVEGGAPEIEGVTWDEFQMSAAQYLFDSLGEDDFWWGVH
jgi:hypothetical protein